MITFENMEGKEKENGPLLVVRCDCGEKTVYLRSNKTMWTLFTAQEYLLCHRCLKKVYPKNIQKNLNFSESLFTE